MLRGKLKLNNLPAAGDTIVIVYEKSDEVLDAVDRINKYYAPTSGMIGKEVNQLMTGIDFGGVQIQGTTFDVSGGWDALPWFTDTWDSVEPNSDYYYIADGSTTFVTLPAAPIEGQQISVYLKRAGQGLPPTIDTLDSAGAPIVVYDQGTDEQPTIRIDDPNFIVYEDGSTGGDSSGITNLNAVMPTFVGDGITKNIEVGQFVQINAGDTLIFRPIESDGTVNITDVNILDTKISGGSFSVLDGAYATATGTAAEDIVVDGSKFISPDQVPAPEENIPGQVLESVSIKVFHTVQTGATPLQAKVSYGNGVKTRYNIGLTILEPQSVVVYIDKIKCETADIDSTLEYEIDYVTNEIVFTNAPEAGSIVEIISIGIGGASILDYQEFIADGETTLFLTRANYIDTASVVVTVDGVSVDLIPLNSSDFLDVKNKTLIQFANIPANRQVIKIVCLGAVADVDSTGNSVVRVNQQVIIFDGSTLSYDLDRFVNLERSNAAGSTLVEINGKQLKGVDTSFVIYDGTNNIIKVGKDPAEAPNTATQENIQVYVNNELRRYILDYNYDGNNNLITVETEVLLAGDEIKVVVDVRSQYRFENNNIVFSGTSFVENDSTTTLQEGDQITVTWFSEYPSMNIVADQFSGGKVQYQLSFEPVSASYIWVYRNGIRLTQDIDYDVSVPRNVVYMKSLGVNTDQIKIVQYGNYLRRQPIGYEVFKDMLNIHHYKRFSLNKDVVLTQNLNYYDTVINVSDTSNLFEPIKLKNIPGTVWINNERIDYFEKTATTLGQLRRGCFGTAIKEMHNVGSNVVDISKTETIPYNEEQERYDFVSDGSSLLIGPLPFVPTQATRSNWYRSTIPASFEPCDQIEVFSAGTRLRKDSITIYDNSLNLTSPEADVTIEADFSVDGVNNYIRLTSAVPAGTRITVIRRTGKTWYDRGENSASNGVTLVKNQNSIVKFLKQRATELPE